MKHDLTGDAPNDAPKTLGLQGWFGEVWEIKNRLIGRFYWVLGLSWNYLNLVRGAPGETRTPTPFENGF
jgi:hypothetical protein